MNRSLTQAAALLAMVTVAGVARAQAQADSKDEIIQKLLDRVDALEREVAALQQQKSPRQRQ